MPRGSDPYEDSEIEELLVEYSDPKVWCHAERGDMVRDINRLAVTVKEARQDLTSYEGAYRSVNEDCNRLRRAVIEVRRALSLMNIDELSTAARNTLLDALNIEQSDGTLRVSHV